MSLILGFSGRARHGKTESTIAVLHAAETDGLGAIVYDIGQIVREAAVEMGRLPRDLQRENMTRKDLDILIAVGKEKRRERENYWTEEILRRVLAESPDVALCPNLRLPMEADSFRRAGGYIVRCTRLNHDGSIFISEDRPPNDITETALEFWPADFYLTTKDGHIDLLKSQAVTVYEYCCKLEGLC